MKEHLLTLIGVAWALGTFFIISIVNSHESIPVFDANDILFQHQTGREKIVLTQNAYDELVLTVLNRGLPDFTYKKSALPTSGEGGYHFILPMTDEKNFTTHFFVSGDPSLSEIIVTESGLPVAHGIRPKSSRDGDLQVFMAASADFTGHQGHVIGLNEAGEIILELDF